MYAGSTKEEGVACISENNISVLLILFHIKQIEALIKTYSYVHLRPYNKPHVLQYCQFFINLKHKVMNN